MLTFNKKYFLVAIVLFLMEVMIALYVRDSIIRPYGGDFLVVIFLYCLLKSFTSISVIRAAVLVLVFAYGIEFLQYFELSGKLGLQKGKLANIVLGSHFEWLDMIAYTLGMVTVIGFEKTVSQKRPQQNPV